MKIRFNNAKILTFDDTVKIIDGELHTDGEKIAYVGKRPADCKNSSENIFDREIDVGQNLLMPGFKNAHTHSPMTFLRSYADDLPLDKWLYEKVFPLEAKLCAEHIYTFTKLAVLEYIASGTTAAFDMYYEPEAVARACSELGFRLVMCGAVNDFKETAETLGKYYEKFNNFHPLISYRLGFHAEYTTNIKILREISELAFKFKAPVFAHNSETKNEVADCIKRHGKTPTELFDFLGMFNYGGGGFHCVHLSENDINIITDKKLWVVTNPASNLKLASGIAPVEKLIQNGVNIAIGTDGAASNNSLNMWREMYLTTALQKYVTGNAAACPAEHALKMAVQNGAYAMGLNDCDTLKAGKQADLIMIDLDMPNMQPLNNIIKNLVYSGDVQNVKMTMIAGKILFENGKFFIGENIRKIYEAANKAVKEITE